MSNYNQSIAQFYSVDSLSKNSIDNRQEIKSDQINQKLYGAQLLRQQLFQKEENEEKQYNSYEDFSFHQLMNLFKQSDKEEVFQVKQEVLPQSEDSQDIFISSTQENSFNNNCSDFSQNNMDKCSNINMSGSCCNQVFQESIYAEDEPSLINIDEEYLQQEWQKINNSSEINQQQKQQKQLQSSLKYQQKTNNNNVSKKIKKAKKQQPKKEKLNPDLIKINTSHVPLNMLNQLFPYLMNVYKEKMPCKCVRAEKFVCKRCQDMRKIYKIKQQKNINIQSFRDLWKISVRVQIISQQYFLHNASYGILGTGNYRNEDNRKALYVCLPNFQRGSNNPQNFKKLLH